jgi:hypothetical protein
MRRFVCTLTAVTLLVHALVGCCRHHDHRGVSCETVECCDSVVAGCCHEEHAAESHHDHQPLAPCDCKLQCKTFCISLPPEKTLLDAGHSTPGVDTVAVESNATASCPTLVAGWRDGLRAFRLSKPPLRLHLLHQVILI